MKTCFICAIDAITFARGMPLSGSKITLISLYNAENISLRAMHAGLKQAGHDVQLIYLKDNHCNFAPPLTSYEQDALRNAVRMFDPDIIGLNLGCSSLFDIACGVTENLRKISDAFIIWGGIHVTLSPNTCIEHADGICILDGEQPILDFANRFSHHRSIDNITNTWVRRNGNVKRNPCRASSADLDLLPMPDFSDHGKLLIDGDVIHKDPHTIKTWQYLTYTGRGCPCRCSFCCNAQTQDLSGGPVVRRRSIGHVIQELETACNSLPNMRSVLFVDEIFIKSASWLEEFLSIYNTKIGLPFACLFTSQYVKPETMRMLRNAGAYEINMGIQSGSERLRHTVLCRYDTNRQIHDAAKHIVRTGMTLKIDLIVNNPYETEEDRKEQLELLLSLPKPFELCMFNLIYFPKTALTQQALADGLITENDIEDRAKNVFRKWAVYVTDSYDKAKLFWICLVSMTGKQWMPNCLIRWLSTSKFLKQHPGILVPFIRFNSLIRWMVKGIPVILKGQAPWPIIRKKWRHILKATK